jgi:HTH-type transcriptional regulator, sugar sensing transcriptional regulator
MEGSALVTELTELGLTNYEARAYLALIRRDSSTASQVARLANLPRQRIYDVLAGLVEKGLASSRPGGVVKYAGVAPGVALERLLENHRRQLQSLEEGAASIVERLRARYERGQEQTDPLEYIEILRDRRAINERFEELQRRMKREILVFTRPPYARPPQENVQGLKVARRYKARGIYLLSQFEDPSFIEGLRRFMEAGEEMRFVEELPLKLAVIDESIVMFGMEDPVAGSSDLTLMVVEHPALARILKIAFDAVWAEGLTFEEAERRHADLQETIATAGV